MQEIFEFEIATYDYAKPSYKDWVLPKNRHFLYILENNRKVYIGETNDIIQRTRDHHKKEDPCYRHHFQKIHVITRKGMDETPAKHLEKMLICLMRIDQKYRVTNESDGERTFYDRKNEFELGFDKLWHKLAKHELVNCKEFQSIQNMAEYKYSPYTSLTPHQSDTLTSIVNAIHTSDSQRQQYTNRTRPILVEGDAGTGKTVIASSLFHYLKTHPDFKGKKIGLVYANTSTRAELKSVFQCVPGHFSKDIISPIELTKQKYDIVICDEAHRLRRNKNLGMYGKHFKAGNAHLGFDNTHDELDWLRKNAECLILLYDSQQIACPSDIPYSEFCRRLEIEDCGVRPVALQEQMRIRAGDTYVPYIHDILHQKAYSPVSFEDYDFKLFDSFSDMIDTLTEKENKMELCRLCGGYAWEWIAKNSPDTPDISIDGVDIWWNKQTKGWLRNPNAKKEMGSIYTLPGLDLNYAAVVIGPDLYFDTKNNEIRVNMQYYFDDKVKRNSTEGEIKQFILGVYGVLMTRGVYGTYVYVCDDALREYMRKFIPTA